MPFNIERFWGDSWDDSWGELIEDPWTEELMAVQAPTAPNVDFVIQPRGFAAPGQIVYLNKRTARSDADDLREITMLYALWAKVA